MRYLRSRRSSRLLSLITVIAVGGVTIGVMALVIVLGIMNGMQNDLREKILVVNPHLRILTYGEGLRLDDWPDVLAKVRRSEDVVAAAPFVLTQGRSEEHTSELQSQSNLVCRLLLEKKKKKKKRKKQ